MDPYRSGLTILRHVWSHERFLAPTVVDVGCGDAGFLRAADELGARELLGIDQAQDSPAGLPDLASYLQLDLRTARPLIEHTFSLAICVEVAEHLPPSSASHLVAFVTSLAPLVLWSAAVPGQGPYPPEGDDNASGAWHIHEQPTWYWKELFSDHDYVQEDTIRPLIADDPDIDPWYVTNIFVYRHAGSPKP